MFEGIREDGTLANGPPETPSPDWSGDVQAEAPQSVGMIRHAGTPGAAQCAGTGTGAGAARRGALSARLSCRDSLALSCVAPGLLGPAEHRCEVAALGSRKADLPGSRSQLQIVHERVGGVTRKELAMAMT